jgi:opacity protein-like surface antigen
MKKILTTLAVGSLLSLNVYGSQHQEEVEHKGYDFYISVKAASILGDFVKEEQETLNGDMGYGIGIDFGYKISHNFAIEIDVAYTQNDVTQTDEEGKTEELSANYISSSLDLVYIEHVNHNFGLFGKVGYEYELEQIDTYEDTSDTGFILAAGAEYKIAEHVALLGEYEYTFIDGPKGNSIYIGLIYGF